MSARPVPAPRGSYRYLRPITTRWLDNDVYGHVNNVVYYLWFDTVVNGFLVERGLLEPTGSGPIGLVAETGCRYLSSVSFPDAVEAASGIRPTLPPRMADLFDRDERVTRVPNDLAALQALVRERIAR